MTWLMQNIGTIIVFLILVLILGSIVFCMVRAKKKGKSTCSGGCAHCALHGTCHKDVK